MLTQATQKISGPVPLQGLLETSGSPEFRKFQSSPKWLIFENSFSGAKVDHTEPYMLQKFLEKDLTVLV